MAGARHPRGASEAGVGAVKLGKPQFLLAFVAAATGQVLLTIEDVPDDRRDEEIAKWRTWIDDEPDVNVWRYVLAEKVQ